MRDDRGASPGSHGVNRHEVQGIVLGSALRTIAVSIVSLLMVLTACSGTELGSDERSPSTTGTSTSNADPTVTVTSSTATDNSSTATGAPTPVEPSVQTAPPVGAAGGDAKICAAPVTLRDKVSELVMVSAEPGRPDRSRRVLESNPFLSGLFIGSRDDTILWDRPFIDLASSGRWFIAIDDEGGRVQRLARIAGDLPSPAVQSASPAATVREMAQNRGAVMRDHGINVDFAPVVDLAEPDGNVVIGDRSYSSDPVTTIDRAGAFAEGLRAAGILPTLKHFPGHGAAVGDSHRGTVTTPDLDTMRRTHLAPYRALAGRAPVAVMVGHLDVPGLTEPGTPSSLSPAVYQLLRNEIGFDGVVFTDDLSGMKAVTGRYSTAHAVERAIAAGADVALLATYDPVPYIDRLVAAVEAGRISMDRVDAAVGHVLAAKDSVGLGNCR